MAYMGIFTFSFIWLALVPCSQVRGRLVMEKHDALETNVYGSEIEVHALNSDHSHRDETVISSELALRLNKSLPVQISSARNIYAPEDDSNLIQHWAEYQSGTGTSKDYYGAKSTLVVYGFPDLEAGKSTTTGIWIANGADGPSNQLNVIQAGWHVLPEEYGDSATHFFIAWTADGYISTGCFNLKCEGFVLTNSSSDLVPGTVIQPLSTPGGPQYEISIRIFKGQSTGDWWLQRVHGDNAVAVGYWPKSLFTSLADKATRVDFGGHVSFQKNSVSPPMGSGYFPTDSKAAYFKNTAYINKDGGFFVNEEPPVYYVDNPHCYNLAEFDPDRFTYGGPGGCGN